MIKRTHVLIGLLAAMCGCIGDDDMAVNPPQYFDASMTGIRQVIDQNGAIVKATDGGPVYKLKAGSGINFVYDITKNAYRADVTGLIGGFVLNTRQIIAGQGLTGGGDLSADRTFNASVVAPLTINFANQIELGTINDVIHGNRSNGALHSLATDVAPGPVNGFVSGSDAGWIYGTRRFEGEDIGPFGGPHVKTVAGLMILDVGGSGAVNLTIDMTQAAPNNPKDGMLISVGVLTVNPGDTLNISANDGWSIAWAFPTVTLANSFASVTLRADLATKFLYIVGSFAFP